MPRNHQGLGIQFHEVHEARTSGKIASCTFTVYGRGEHRRPAVYTPAVKTGPYGMYSRVPALVSAAFAFLSMTPASHTPYETFAQPPANIVGDSAIERRTPRTPQLSPSQGQGKQGSAPRREAFQASGVASSGTSETNTAGVSNHVLTFSIPNYKKGIFGQILPALTM